MAVREKPLQQEAFSNFMRQRSWHLLCFHVVYPKRQQQFSFPPQQHLNPRSLQIVKLLVVLVFSLCIIRIIGRRRSIRSLENKNYSGETLEKLTICHPLLINSGGLNEDPGSYSFSFSKTQVFHKSNWKSHRWDTELMIDNTDAYSSIPKYWRHGKCTAFIHSSYFELDTQLAYPR